jgi:hypothetical protein
VTEGSALFVALPAANDPIHDIIDDPHITLMYFGDAAEVEAAHPEVVTDLLEIGDFVAPNIPAFSAKVSGRAVIGEDQARVLLVESLGLVDLYRTLLEMDPIDVLLAEHEERHPWWIPHMTYGYGEDGDPFDAPAEISIVQLGLWWGEDRAFWPLTGPGMETELASGVTPVIDCADDIPVGIRVANSDPSARWYVQRRAKALGCSHLLPEWAGA